MLAQGSGTTTSNPMFEFVVRHQATDAGDWYFEIDEYRRPSGEQFLLAHIAFRKFSLTALKEVDRHYRVFRQYVNAPLWAVCNDGDLNKWKRFISRYDFKPTGIWVTCNNGETRELFLSSPVNCDVHPNLPNTKLVLDYPVGTAGQRS